jgi:PAS domain S-box-containing protein
MRDEVELFTLNEVGGLAGAESVLQDLANVFLRGAGNSADVTGKADLPNLDAKYRTLIEQLPAVVFLVYLDRGSGEAYVSPQIEQMLGFTREEWLEDPIRWYQQVHPDDKLRWSEEAAAMFLSGNPIRSVYRVVARDGRVVSFHCEAKMVRQSDGRPWFIHGVGFDVTDLKRAEKELQEERNFASAVLDTVGALVMVLDPDGRIVRFNRACERISGYSLSEVAGKRAWDLFAAAEDRAGFQEVFDYLRAGEPPSHFESRWVTRNSDERLVSWSGTALTSARGDVEHVIMTGIDVTESKRLERAILDVSGREQRRIGQDLHDGLGQHLTGIAFMSKVLEQKLGEKAVPEAAEAAKIVKLVNEAIYMTRELSRGLLPVLSQPRGLMSALEQLASEVQDLFRISCVFSCRQPVLIRDDAVATHLYHIAQEAVNNAIKHGQAARIAIVLSAGAGRAVLAVEDNGVGISKSPANPGMGLHIMSYRAKMVGGAIEVRRLTGGGTLVRCSFPSNQLEPGESA